MEDLLIEILETFPYPVRLQGSLLPDEPYPPCFFTFWNHGSASESYYDDGDNAIIYDYDVNFYSTDPELTYSVLREAIELLKEAGFIVSGDGHSVGSDDVNYTGRGVDVIYRKEKENE